jgi:Predicted transcriptional regulator
MPSLQTISTQIPPDIFARIEEIAHSRKCSNSDILKEALESYLSSADWFEAKVKQGLADLSSGRKIPHVEVMEKFRRLGVDVD